MLRDLKEAGINVATTIAVIGLTSALAAGLVLVLGREAYRDWRNR